MHTVCDAEFVLKHAMKLCSSLVRPQMGIEMCAPRINISLSCLEKRQLVLAPYMQVSAVDNL